jgi:predicted metal-dependent hydrolase
LGAEEIQERLFFAGLEVSVRRSRRRRSLGLTVTAEGRVIVAAPQGASQDLLLQVLSKHQAWIKRKLAERAEAWARLPAGAVFFLGQAYRLALLPGAMAPVELAAGEIRVRGSSAAGAWTRLQDWYRQEADRLIRERVHHYARGQGLKVRRVELRAWRRRWGECQPQEALRFNWRLILLPPEILDYVVVHELAHLREPGHNPRFWHWVEETLPDYRQRRHWLNRSGTPFLLWSL